MYGTRQVGELILGNAYATETTIQTFIANTADKKIKALSEDGTNVAANVPFKLVQKTAGDATKGLNYEFSDVIIPKYVEKVTLGTYLAETQRAFKIAGFTGNVVANYTYAVEVRVYNDGGSLSPENFAVVQGYYVTGANITAETATTIRDGLYDSLNANLIKRGNNEFVLTKDASPLGFTITGKFQTPVPGKIIGKPIEFDVLAMSFQNVQDLTQPQQNTGLLTSTLFAAGNPGSGTGKFAVNFEWFVKGYKYEAYRQTGYPADFATPYYASINGVYNTVQIIYYKPRRETSVEHQYKVLTILVDKVTDTNPNNAATNALLADLRTAIGTNATIPADLPII